MNQAYIIAIAGGSGSGKTYLAHCLQERLGDEMATVISQDSYYFDQSAKFDHDGGSVNFDHPDAIDFSLLASHLGQLKLGNSVEIPIYDFATHSRLSQTTLQPPKKVILVDGILILNSPEVREVADTSIFVETPESVRFERRLKRDIEHRGRTEEGVRAQFSAQVKPMHDQFVEPSKFHARHITSGTCLDSLNKMLEHVAQLVANSRFL